MLINILEPNFHFEDMRGSLTQLVRKGYSQFNVVSSVAGSLRGGHYHELNLEAFYIIYGMLELEVWKKDDNNRERYIFSTGDMFEIPPNVVHSFYYKSESLLVSMYSKGVELSDGSKDIISSEETGISTEIINLPEKKIEKDNDDELPNCVSELWAGTRKELKNIKKLNIRVNNENRFKLKYKADYSGLVYVKCFILREKKLKLKIENIVCISDENEYEIDSKLIRYNEAECMDNGFYDIKSLDPSFEFELPSENIKEIIISGQWFLEYGFSEIKSAYYHMLGKNEGYSYSQRDEYIKELKKRLHQKENKVKAAEKHQEKAEVYSEVLERDVKERDEIIKELEYKLKAVAEANIDFGFTNKLLRPWEKDLKLIEAENKVLIKENEQIKLEIAELKQRIDKFEETSSSLIHKNNEQMRSEIKDIEQNFINFKDFTTTLFHEKHEMILADRVEINNIQEHIKSDVKWIETIREEIYNEIYKNVSERKQLEDKVNQYLINKKEKNI